MTEPFRPDDDLVSAVLDGEATEAERARVAADPVLAARLAEFTAAAERVAEPVAPRAEADRDRAIAAAVAERHRREDVVVALRRDRSHDRHDSPRFLAAAAVVLVVLLAAGFLIARVGSDGGNDSASGGGSASRDTAADRDAEAESSGQDAATVGAFEDGSIVPFGVVTDEAALRQALVASGALARSTDDSVGNESGDGNSSGAGPVSTTVPAADAPAPVEGDGEDCQIRLEEADPSLAGRIVRGTAVYRGEDAVVFVFGTADGDQQVIVVSADTCRTLASFPL